MTALNKLVSKGVILSQSVSAVYVALAGLMSLDVSGEKSIAEDTTTLDGGVYKTKTPNGHAEPPIIKAGGLYDPQHATYTNLMAILSTPTVTNFKVQWTDAGPTSAIYSVASVGLNKKAAVGKMIDADITLETSGAPS